MSSVLSDLGITVWKSRSGLTDCQVERLDNGNDGKFAIVLDKAAYAKYLAKDQSIIKFIGNMALFLADSFPEIIVKNSAESLDNNALLALTGSGECLASFYTVEQLFLYPERKKELYNLLATVLSEFNES